MFYQNIYFSIFNSQFKMIQIGDVVVSLDVFQEKFLCDLGACKGACCIEGDACLLYTSQLKKTGEIVTMILVVSN